MQIEDISLQHVLESTTTEDRLNFHRWISSMFVQETNKNFPKTTEDIHAIYCECYNREGWELQHTQLMLYLFGLLNEGTNVAYLSPNYVNIPTNEVALRAFIVREKNPIHYSKLLDMLNGEKLVKNIENKHKTLTVTRIKDNRESLEYFYSTWCVKANAHPIIRHMSLKWHKSPLGTLYRAYEWFCKLHDVPFVSRKELWAFIEAKGHSKSKGYAAGIAGCNFFHNLYVPGCRLLAELAYATIRDGFILCNCDKDEDALTFYDIRGCEVSFTNDERIKAEAFKMQYGQGGIECVELEKVCGIQDSDKVASSQTELQLEEQNISTEESNNIQHSDLATGGIITTSIIANNEVVMIDESSPLPDNFAETIEKINLNGAQTGRMQTAVPNISAKPCSEILGPVGSGMSAASIIAMSAGKIDIPKIEIQIPVADPKQLSESIVKMIEEENPFKAAFKKGGK